MKNNIHKKLILSSVSIIIYLLFSAFNAPLIWALPDDQVQKIVRTDPVFAYVEHTLLDNWSMLPKQYKNMYRQSYLDWIKFIRDRNALRIMQEGITFNEAYTIETALFNNLLRDALPRSIQRRLYYIDMEQLYQLMAKARNKNTSRTPYSRPNRTETEPHKNLFGTGFFISNDGGIVTNYHVIKNMKNIMIFDPKYNIWSTAEVMRFDKTNDVALLWSNRSSKPLPISSRFNMRKGEQIFTLGYPSPDLQGSHQKATFGRINSLMGIEDDVRYFQIDSPIQPGNSGGPVFNESGEVIGIASSRLTGDFQNVNYALKIDYLLPLLGTVVSDLDKFDDPNQKPEPGTLPQLVERYEDSVIMIVAD
jgi:S1-C subfamily serine protease